MLFLDDFLEMLDELPAELKERSDEVRRLDVEVEARLKRNRDAVTEFFEQTAVSMTEEQRMERYRFLQEEYNIIRGIAEQKFNIAKKMQELLTKYQNHLEKEKTNFQCEMEADNSGVTEMIEKRYTEFVQSIILARKERKRKHTGGSSSRDSVYTSGALSKESNEKIARILQEGVRLRMDLSDESAIQSAMSSAVPSPAPRGRPPKNNPMLSSTAADDSMGALSAQRRRSTANPLRGSVSIPGMASLNSPSVKMSPNPSERSWSNMGVDESPTSILPNFSPHVPSFVGSESRHGRPRKLTSRVQEMFKETLHRQRNHGNSMQSLQDRMQANQISMPAPNTPTFQLKEEIVDEEDDEGDDEEDEGSDEEGSEDSRRWCFCHEKSYGEMVACDNKNCPLTWFHYPCVGIKAPPVGKWYCPNCVNNSIISTILAEEAKSPSSGMLSPSSGM